MGMRLKKPYDRGSVVVAGLPSSTGKLDDIAYQLPDIGWHSGRTYPQAQPLTKAHVDGA